MIVSDDSGYCLKLLEALTKTYKFDIFVKTLTKKEKQGKIPFLNLNIEICPRN